MLAALPAVVLAALLMVTGCAGQADSGGDADDGATDESTSAPDQEGGSMLAVDAVVVQRGGGISGAVDTFRVRLNDPDAGDVLAMAATLPKEGVPGKASEAPCCDIYSYAVTVQYASGDTARFHTYDGDAGPVHDLAMAVLEASAPRS